MLTPIWYYSISMVILWFDNHNNHIIWIWIWIIPCYIGILYGIIAYLWLSSTSGIPSTVTHRWPATVRCRTGRRELARAATVPGTFPGMGCLVSCHWCLITIDNHIIWIVSIYYTIGITWYNHELCHMNRDNHIIWIDLPWDSLGKNISLLRTWKPLVIQPRQNGEIIGESTNESSILYLSRHRHVTFMVHFSGEKPVGQL
jgi:hypothetical protein